MGCICSKESSSDKDKVDENEKENNELKKSTVQLVAPNVSTAELNGGGGGSMEDDDGSVPHMAKSYSQIIKSCVPALSLLEDKNNNNINNPLDVVVKSSTKGKNQHQTCITLGGGERKPMMSRILSVPHGLGGHIDNAWPSWLSSVAGEAIKGWVPRRADSFEKLDQIGQGAYSSVHKARDLETGKIVALKKIRFSSSDPESVRFMAREIYILRQLDHPNVIKLEGIVTSTTSTSLYLVFEYMEHDLAGLAALPGIKFTEPQIKCYIKQLLCGLEHCHQRGVLHRDIKGSNLLIDNNGNLQIGDFGLATVYDPDKKQALTSRVVTLWYRAPELLLGATEYGSGIDLWSVGCILAELLVGKPIMPGRTEVEQMHKIFKLCGSPSEEYWQRTKLPHATSFKPQHSYKRNLFETFKSFPSSALALVDKLLAIEPENRGSATSALNSEFLTTNPLPCDPSSLPKFPPSKELDARRRDKEEMRKNNEIVKGREPLSVLRGAGNTKGMRSPERNIIIQGKSHSRNSIVKNQSHEDDGSHHKKDPTRVSIQNGYTHSTSMMHGSATGQSSMHKLEDMSRKNPDLRTQSENHVTDFSASSIKRDQGASGRGYVAKKNRIHYSGPLVPPGGNIDDMLKEHERLMQEAFRSVKKTNHKN
ncbi:hypothetical protein TanjilG_17982 [Lupinus angustifolius]|uniref:Protein kinase domain-containing protein n=1 Tax=Lupinus angustifolius TaxID=3871 RepID=A0A1J7FXA7_LUPAN|nr:PREDICTED: probable serine/threonine-protein kinase At1g09600 [Lupinus angustifolius]OIV92631.1 hypothetical protein TanjilG_17982 [Lupinus angustifolius]